MKSIIALLILFASFNVEATVSCSDIFFSGFRNVKAVSQADRAVFGDYIDAKGQVLLFRTIVGQYQKDFVGGFTRTEGAISYALDPEQAIDWAESMYASAPQKDKFVLVAIQNMKTDKLKYPSEDRVDALNERYGTITFDSETYQKILKVLKRTTPILDMWEGLTEVKVPVEAESVRWVLSLRQFKKFLKDFRAESHTDSDQFLKALERDSRLPK